MTQMELFTSRNVTGLHTEVPVVGRITQLTTEGVDMFVQHVREAHTPDDLLGKGQAAAILAYLRAGHSLTPLEALERFGCLRLGARVWELVRAGWPIKTEMVTLENGKRVARYSLRG